MRSFQCQSQQATLCFYPISLQANPLLKVVLEQYMVLELLALKSYQEIQDDWNTSIASSYWSKLLIFKSF